MYLALYRKWRPSDFDSVYGQPHITKTLKKEVAAGRFSHAYLFTGSRGTGKTSCAKILAKAINCPHSVDGNPCNECEICKGIDNGSLTDVVEMDAASNNGVDEIRTLRDEVVYTPAVAKYRVYIIDEVHMLSASAFNALLKTLEEPPEHVIFILATTEVQKVIPTILSRCQRFDFRRLSSDDIIKRLNFVAAQENITLSEDAASLIANVADGGMRDALSILDRCFAITNNITAQTVSDAAGVTSTENLFKFSDYIAKEDFKSALLLLTELYRNFCDIAVLSLRLLDHFRNIMVAKSVNKCDDLIICSASELEQYKKEAEKFTLSKILECIDILSAFGNTVKDAGNKRILLESALVKMCGVRNAAARAPQPAAVQSVSQPAPAPVTQPASQPAPAAESKPAAKETGKTAPEQTPGIQLADGAFSLWPEIIEKLKSYSMPLYSMLSGTKALIKNGKILILTENAGLKDFIIKNNYASSLKNAIVDVTGREMKAAISVINQENGPKPEEDKSPLNGLFQKIDEFNSQE